jgi:hypothetical protein
VSREHVIEAVAQALVARDPHTDAALAELGLVADEVNNAYHVATRAELANLAAQGMSAELVEAIETRVQELEG